MNLNFNQNKKNEKVNDIDADEFEEEIEEEKGNLINRLLEYEKYQNIRNC